jgi:hypothetical protein
MTDTIDIDRRPSPVLDQPARVDLDPAGKPCIVPQSPARWHAALLRVKGQLVRVTVARLRSRRSGPQNAYLWSTVYPHVLEGLRALALDAGEVCPVRDDSHLHRLMKHRFLSAPPVRLGGEDFTDEPTTTQLDIEEFSAYVSAIQAWAAQRGVYVPAAGEDAA